MKSEAIQRMQNRFDSIAQTVPDSDVEFWFARELQEPLGYARWENFQTAIRRAVEACETTGYNPEHHFRGVTKLITPGKGGQQAIVAAIEAEQALVDANRELITRFEKRSSKPSPASGGRSRRRGILPSSLRDVDKIVGRDSDING